MLPAVFRPQPLLNWAFNQDQGSRSIRLAKTCLRVLTIMGHEFRKTKISLRAAALTYSIVLSMVPLLALSTAVLKGLGSDNQLRLAAVKLVEQLEPAPHTETTTEVLTTEKPHTMTGHLHRAIDTIFEYVDNTNFAALGAFGIVTLFLAALLVLNTIEDALNAIWHAEQQRPLFRRIMYYLALLLLLPLSINIGLAGEAALENDRILLYLQGMIPASWLLKMLFKMLPFFCIVLSLIFLYLFFPSTKVKTGAALAGSLFAALFWFITQKIYFLLQIGLANYNAIYGSFATVPLFLVWLHLGWTFILLGASFAHAIQNRNLFSLHHAEGKPARDLQLAFDILDIVYHRFSQRQATCLDDLSTTLHDCHPQELTKINQLLVKAELLRVIQDTEDQEGFVPAIPREGVQPSEVVHHLLGEGSGKTIGARLSHAAMTAAKHAVDGEQETATLGRHGDETTVRGGAPPQSED
jgi:membrane protein